MSSSSPSSDDHLPLKPLPGGYGLPFFGPLHDRVDYFYNQGKDTFFRSRILKYDSTVFKTNMPPGPFISSNSHVVAVLDAVSFTVLFDSSKVEKRDVLDGTFMPSTAFTGHYRACAFLDTTEPDHTALKRFFLSLIASRHNVIVPLFRDCLSELFINLEDQVLPDKSSGADFSSISDSMSFGFVFRFLCGKSPPDPKLTSDGPKMFDKWIIAQLSPLGSLGLPKIFKYFDDFLVHTVQLPFFLVKNDYNKLYDAYYSSLGSVLDEAEEKFGIEKEKACHNLVFLAGFNAYGGMKVLFPSLIKWIAGAGEEVHRQLADEIRTVVQSEGGVTLNALEKMELTKSVVYEVLRIDPPVPFQYAKAREDIVVHSHDAKFVIKKGEMIFGYQPFATKDPKVFERPEEFLGHRFVGEGKKLLKHVYWSNGRETEDPTAENKQCPAKNMVVLLARVMLVELFLRYDTFTVEIKSTSLQSSSVIFKSLTKASIV